MPTTTPKGFPVPVLGDPPNGPNDIGALATFIDNLLTGTTGKVFSSNAATSTDVEWIWPRARVVANRATIVDQTLGDIVWQTSGADAGYYIWNGADWVRITPDTSKLSKGWLAGASQGGAGVSDSTFAATAVNLESGRRYRIDAWADVQAPIGQDIVIASQLVTSTFLTRNLPRTPTLYSTATFPTAVLNGSWSGFTGSGAVTFSLRLWKVSGSAPNFSVISSAVNVVDEGKP